MSFFAAIGRSFLILLSAIGRVTLFAVETVSHIARPPYYPRELATALLQIGYFSLPAGLYQRIGRSAYPGLAPSPA